MTSNTLLRASSDTPKRVAFRPDIQGLRAVAVGVVVLYHAGAPFLPGGFVGVDAFFVISGFLITGLLLREATTNGRIDLAEFYSRRARRILPAATIVLLVTAAATVLLLPRTRWENIGSEILGSAFYLVNWVFAGNTNYLNADVPPSPLQHFWTLAVEEQFYIVWPLLLIALLYISRPKSHSGRGRSARRTEPSRVRRWLELGAILITVPSLVWSIVFTATNPAPSYFVTTTRLWELGIGACVAVFAVYLQRLPKAAGYILGWAGLAALVSAAVFYTSDTPFPGVAALLPTLGAAAIIIGGMAGRESLGVGYILGVYPMRWVGDISYSLYLWHWPLIVIGTYLLGGDLELWQGLAIVFAAVLPAWLSYRFVENRYRDWEYVAEDKARSLQLGFAMMMVSALAGMFILLTPPPG